MNKFIYFPAISIGLFSNLEKSGIKLPDGTDLAFYEKTSDPTFYYPYMLISAGHNYKCDSKKGFKYNLDDDKIVLGDSGGYQIATGVLKYKPELIQKIFDWLENNTNYAINLDIPPFKNGKMLFEDCLQKTRHNMEFFQNNQSGKTKYINVLQGSTLGKIDEWYTGVKDFEFSGGWAIGGSVTFHSLYMTLLTFFYLYSKKEIDLYEKKGKKFLFHFLGAASYKKMAIFSYLQYKLDATGYEHVNVSSDASSPFTVGQNMARYYLWHNKGNICTSKNEIKNLNAKLPCECPVCKNLTWGDLLGGCTEDGKGSILFYGILALHNIYYYVSYRNEIVDIMDTGCHELIHSAFPSNISKVFSIIDKLFESKDPVAELNHYTGAFRAFDDEVKKETLDIF